MRLTPRTLMTALRTAGVIAGLAAVVALTGPFKYKDLHLPFPDTVAHAILFYGLTLVVTGALPRSRAFDVALTFIGLGLASEIAQSMVGREMSLHDLAGDSIGVVAAYTPVAVGRLRDLMRTHPDASFAELHRLDRRHAEPPRPAVLVLETLG